MEEKFNLKQWQQFEAIVEDLAFGWEWIIKIDWFVIFIKWAIPWQKVKAALIKNRKSFWEAIVLEVLEKSQYEINPKCKYFWRCWWCKWQNLNYKDQLKYKEKQVSDCLERLGKGEIYSLYGSPIWCLSEIHINSCLPSPQVYSYRNKVDFSFGYESMSVSKNEEWIKIYNDINPWLWFHKRWKWQEIISIAHCDLISKNANEVYKIIKDWCFSKKNLQVYNPFSHKWYWRGMLLRENLKGELMINLIVQDEEFEDNISWFFQQLIDLLANHNVKSLFITNNEWPNDDWSKYEPVLISWDSVIYEELLWLKFAISPKSFFQTNSKWAEQLYWIIMKYLLFDEMLSDWWIILDLYCWTWTIGQIISKLIKKEKKWWIMIIWIESVQSAIDDAIKNAKLNWLNNCEFICWAVEKVLPWIVEKYQEIDLVILDPPRSWLHEMAIQTLLKVCPKQIIYVSCNPSTFARDLKLLSEKFELLEVQPVDMFPHTAHIEVVWKLVLR